MAHRPRNLHHLRPAEPARLDLRRHPEQTLEPDHADDMVRRASILHWIAPEIDKVPHYGDADLIAEAVSALGDVAAAYQHAHTDIGGEWRRLAAVAFRAMEDEQRRAAAK